MYSLRSCWKCTICSRQQGRGRRAVRLAHWISVLTKLFSASPDKRDSALAKLISVGKMQKLICNLLKVQKITSNSLNCKASRNLGLHQVDHLFYTGMAVDDPGPILDPSEQRFGFVIIQQSGIAPGLINASVDKNTTFPGKIGHCNILEVFNQ